MDLLAGCAVIETHLYTLVSHSLLRCLLSKPWLQKRAHDVGWTKHSFRDTESTQDHRISFSFPLPGNSTASYSTQPKNWWPVLTAGKAGKTPVPSPRPPPFSGTWRRMLTTATSASHAGISILSLLTWWLCDVCCRGGKLSLSSLLGSFGWSNY